MRCQQRSSCVSRQLVLFFDGVSFLPLACNDYFFIRFFPIVTPLYESKIVSFILLFSSLFAFYRYKDFTVVSLLVGPRQFFFGLSHSVSSSFNLGCFLCLCFFIVRFKTVIIDGLFVLRCGSKDRDYCLSFFTVRFHGPFICLIVT